MSKKTGDPLTFIRSAREVSVVIEATAADATVSVGVNDSAGGIEWRAVGTVTGADIAPINPELAYDHIKVAGQGADKFVICKGGE